MTYHRMTTREHVAAREMWGRGLNTKEIAAALGINRDTLWMHIRTHRDEFPERRHHIGWWRETLRQVEGLTPRQAAIRLGVSDATVSHWRKRIREGR